MQPGKLKEIKGVCGQGTLSELFRLLDEDDSGEVSPEELVIFIKRLLSQLRDDILLTVSAQHKDEKGGYRACTNHTHGLKH